MNVLCITASTTVRLNTDVTVVHARQWQTSGQTWAQVRHAQ